MAQAAGAAAKSTSSADGGGEGGPGGDGGIGGCINNPVNLQRHISFRRHTVNIEVHIVVDVVVVQSVTGVVADGATALLLAL